MSDPDDLARAKESLEADVVTLARAVVDKMAHDLRYGSIQQKNMILAKVAPYLLKQLERQDEESVALKHMRTEMDDIFRAMADAPDTPTEITAPDDTMSDARLINVLKDWEE